MAISSIIKSRIAVSYSASSSVYSGSAIYNLLAYSSLLYTCPSGKIAKVITKKFDRVGNINLNNASPAGQATIYFSALGVHGINNFHGIPQQGRWFHSGDRAIDAKNASTFLGTLALNGGSSSTNLWQVYNGNMILDGTGGASYQNILSTAWLYYNQTSYSNSSSVAAFLRTGPRTNFLGFSDLSGRQSSLTYSNFSEGPDHCYLSSGEGLVASIAYDLPTFGSSISVSGLTIFAGLSIEYLVVEETAS